MKDFFKLQPISKPPFIMKKILLLLLLFSGNTILFGQQAGTLDPSFDLDGLVVTSPSTIHDNAHTMGIQSDGKIVVGGYGYLPGNDRMTSVSRFNPDGSIDSTFGLNGHVFINLIPGEADYCNELWIQNDGKIVFLGLASTSGVAWPFIVRLLSDGTLDPSFATNGIAEFNIFPNGALPYSIIQDDQGRTLVSGIAYPGSFVIRLLETGVADSTFDGDGLAKFLPFPGNYPAAYDIMLDSFSRIIIAGSNSQGPGYLFACMDSTGTIDSTFGLNGYSFFPKTGLGILEDLTLQDDGKIVACGYFDTTGTSNDYNFVIMRINPDGTADSSFANNGIFEYSHTNKRDALTSVILQSDGKILAAGGCQDSLLSWDFALIRLNDSGEPDTSFGVNGLVFTDFNNSIDIGSTVRLQADSKIVVCGYTFQNSKNNVALARYYPGGLSNTWDISDQSPEPVLYPNPSNEFIRLKIDSKVEVEKINILDMYGRCIYTCYKNNCKEQNSNLIIDISSLSSGLYFLQIESEKSHILKFIKSN